MNTNGRQLADHWTWAAEKGLMNSNTAHSLKSASTQVLSVLDNWEELDVSSLDVDDVIMRFKNKRSRDFTPQSLEVYGRRFKKAVTSFLAYAKNPGAWKPATKQRTIREKGKISARENVDQEEARVASSDSPVAKGGLIEYPFPLRSDVTARLLLPRDLKAQELKRLQAFMTTLIVESES
jgi:hypothetical protein